MFWTLKRVQVYKIGFWHLKVKTGEIFEIRGFVADRLQLKFRHQFTEN